MESNPGYKGDIELYIKNGTIKSNNSNVIYEYTTNNTNTKVKDINITGGTFTSDAKKDVFNLSDSFKTNHPKFISGGTYSSDPSNYLKSGYSSSKNNSLYEVTSSTMSVFGSNSENSSNTPMIIFITIIVIISGIIIYLNRNKILNILKK